MTIAEISLEIICDVNPLVSVSTSRRRTETYEQLREVR